MKTLAAGLRACRSPRGTAILEFALVFPVFLVLVLGLVDLARYYFYEQSVSHTLREAGRYAVTGQLASNTAYSGASNSFPYLTRRQTIIAVAQSNNPAGLTITAGATNYTTNDNFLIMSSSNFNGPWSTNSTTGIGDDFVRLSLTNDFFFVTPLLNTIASSLNQGNPFKIGATLIMKNESFNTNQSSATNGVGQTTNYWN